MMAVKRTLFSLIAIAFVGALASSSTMSCAPAQPALGEDPELPDSKSFIDNNVSQFMERRCASLDCHGQRGRPLRLYSQYGLRYGSAAGGVHDKGPTTADERLQNYFAVVGLEPENLARCFFKDDPGNFAQLQLLKKPLSIENGGIRHKGGPVLGQNENDRGWKCLYGWACGQDFSKEDCDAASTL